MSKLGLNSNIKKFSYSFICGKGYSPPPKGENSPFVYSLAARMRAVLMTEKGLLH